MKRELKECNNFSIENLMGSLITKKLGDVYVTASPEIHNEMEKNQKYIIEFINGFTSTDNNKLNSTDINTNHILVWKEGFSNNFFAEESKDYIPCGIYRHFKGQFYEVICVAESQAREGKLDVVYKAMYGDRKVYTRDLDEFISKTDKQKYPDAIQYYRFEYVSFEKIKKIQY